MGVLEPSLGVCSRTHPSEEAHHGKQRPSGSPQDRPTLFSNTQEPTPPEAHASCLEYSLHPFFYESGSLKGDLPVLAGLNFILILFCLVTEAPNHRTATAGIWKRLMCVFSITRRKPSQGVGQLN